MLDSLERLGISYAEVTTKLEHEGVDKFEKSWGELLDGRHPRAREGARREHPRRRRHRCGGGRRRRARARRWSPTGSRAGSSPRTPRCGARPPRPSRPSGCPGSALPRTSRHLVGEVAALRDELAADRLRPRRALRHGRLLARPRGHLRHRRACRSSCSTPPTPTSCAARSPDLERTVVVVSSKSGSTVETDSQRRALRAGLHRRRHRPDRPGWSSSPTRAARSTATPASAGYRVVNADPDVGGRYSALTAFGLVPSGAGRGRHRGPARRRRGGRRPARRRRRRQPGAAPGRRDGRHRAAARQARARRRRHRDRRLRRLGRAAHRRVHRQGRHRHPARSSSIGADAGPPLRRRHRRAPRRRPTPTATARGCRPSPASAVTRRRPARRASSCSGRPPPRSPAGCSASTRSTSPTSRAPSRRPASCSTPASAPGSRRRPFTDGAVEVRAAAAATGSATPTHASTPRSTRCSASSTASTATSPCMAYLDRLGRRRRSSTCARDLFDRTGRPATFGWGPRFLHSTGQYHKGGPPIGVYLQVTTAPARGPRRARAATSPSAQFIAAQAGGDATVLADHGRPVLRLHLTDARRRARAGRARRSGRGRE